MTNNKLIGYDFELTVSGTRRGFICAEDPDSGTKLFQMGLAPALAPQQRTDADSLYEGQDPNVALVFASEKWTTGAGYSDAVVDACVCTRYNYSRGVDLSVPGQATLSAKRNATLDSNGAAIVGAPLEFIETTLGTFMITADRIYEWDTSALNWISRDTSGSNRRGAVEHNSTVYVPRGQSNAYLYSTDGVTWTASTRSSNDKYADCFCTRGDDGQASLAYNVLVRLRANRVSVTTDGVNGGANFSTEDTIGPTNETANWIIPEGNDVYIFKREGVYSFNFTDVDDLWKTNYLKADNATYVYQWSNGLFYANYGDRLLEFDPINTTFRYIFPLPEMDVSEIKGSIVGISGTETHLYVAIKNLDGRVYIMKGRPDEAWHTWATTTTTTQAIAVIGPVAVLTANPVLLAGYGEGAGYYILPRANMRPIDDPNYKFESNGTFTVVGPWVNNGAAAYSKFLNRGTLLGSNMSASNNAVFKYDIDDGSTPTLLTATQNGLTYANVSDEVEYNRIRYIIEFNSAAEDTSPTVFGWTFQSTLNAPRYRVWSITTNLSNSQTIRDQVQDYWQDVAALEDFLFAAVNRKVTLTDSRNRDYTVKVSDLRSQGFRDSRVGGEERTDVVYQIQLIEITPSSPSINPLVWNVDAWNDNHQYS